MNKLVNKSSTSSRTPRRYSYFSAAPTMQITLPVFKGHPLVKSAMCAIRVGPALAAFAFVLAIITSVSASTEGYDYLPPTSTVTNVANPQSECLNRELPSKEEANITCMQQGERSNVDSNGRIVSKSMCSVTKLKRDCEQPLVEVAAECSPSSANIFRSINAFMEEFFCAGKSVEEQIASMNKTGGCTSYFDPQNLPEKCTQGLYTLGGYDQTEMWSKSPGEVLAIAQTQFDCFNTAITNCGLSGHSLCKTSLAKALPRSGCPSSANNPFVYASMTGLWWILVFTGLSTFL